MLIQLDQSTLAYMTAALEGVCKRIPPEKDSSDLRKRIADAMISCANNNHHTYVDFEEAGLNVLNEACQLRATTSLVRTWRPQWFKDAISACRAFFKSKSVESRNLGSV